MNRNDLRHTDISLLVVFETMMRERNVTRAGEKLFLCQPTISSALGRLRTRFNDPLFIRTGRVMEPTSRAEEIHVRLGPALEGIALALKSFSLLAISPWESVRRRNCRPAPIAVAFARCNPCCCVPIRPRAR